MSIRRYATIGAALLTLSGVGAFAADGTVTSDTLAAGTTVVARCDTTPTFDYGFTKGSGALVTSVTVSAIDSACTGGKLSLAVRPANATGGPVTLTGCSTTCSATVTLSSPTLPADITSVVVSIVGP